ncbi:transglutaminase-like domain-containing protein [Prolixibacteraceae bacterium Z1-6]|uniref:Transglutaminase-like domain-containing protein n=1 Tax=Draconibacterium aestuarii TaxID=2998507 RepID=A0A9X3FBZ3_9BACT|nr:transglutaminase-like domain-containing protein [Prolixibacteraceae bacterium Z1-6]
MKTIFRLSNALALSVFLWTAAAGQSLNNLPKSWNFAVEINGVLCGFSESEISTIERDGKELLSLNEEVLVKQSALGGKVDLIITNRALIEPSTQLPVFVEQRFKTTAEVYSSTKFSSGIAYFTSVEGGEVKKIQLTDGVVLENTISYPHLMRDFILGNEKEKQYQVFDNQKGEIVTKNYTRAGEEELELVGTNFNTIILEEFNQNSGITTKLWLNKENSCPLKINVSNRVIYLADKSVKKRIQIVNLDNLLYARVNKIISNIHDISYMQIEASISSEGERITHESLNFAGQKFEGTVTNNLTEGVFEIEKQAYSGENAPAFPPGFTDEDLNRYLEPESLIESDHPVLIKEAQQITEGSADSWEAVVRLSKWVGENIMGALPGGTSAINTYNTREGECGSHSRLLAAFCRAVGIPARLSIGCMYISYAGGCFYQHAWTEVYMGDAGWVAVDATAHEFDFVDAGHIRLGEKTSFNPKAMKILDYRMGNESVDKTVPDEYKKYLGSYNFEERNRIFKILYQDGSLAVDIPDAQVLALNPPDENGVFYPKVTKQLNFSFENDLYGNIAKMKLQQVIPLGKKFELDSIGSDVPEEFKPLVGNYWFAQAQADFKVSYQDGVLALHDPLAKTIVKLPEQTDTGLWKDEFGTNELEFVRNENDEVIRMLIYVNVYLTK